MDEFSRYSEGLLVPQVHEHACSLVTGLSVHTGIGHCRILEINYCKYSFTSDIPSQGNEQ